MRGVRCAEEKLVNKKPIYSSWFYSSITIFGETSARLFNTLIIHRSEYCGKRGGGDKYKSMSSIFESTTSSEFQLNI